MVHDVGLEVVEVQNFGALGLREDEVEHEEEAQDAEEGDPVGDE